MPRGIVWNALLSRGACFSLRCATAHRLALMSAIAHRNSCSSGLSCNASPPLAMSRGAVVVLGVPAVSQATPIGTLVFGEKVRLRGASPLSRIERSGASDLRGAPGASFPEQLCESSMPCSWAAISECCLQASKAIINGMRPGGSSTAWL